MIANEPEPEPEPPTPIERLPRIARATPGLFYGWWVVVALAAVAFVAVGIGFYGQTLLLDGLVRRHGWSRTSVSGAASVYFVVSALAGALVGRAVDRYGGRPFLAAGCAVLAATLLGVSAVREPWHLYVLFPVMAIGFALAGNVASSAIVARWFVSQRALALSLSYTGVSLGGMLLVPVGAWLLETRGLEFAMQTLSALVLVVGLPWIVFAVRESPEPYGLTPDGGRRSGADNPLLDPVWQRASWRSRDALRTRAFWVLSIAFAGALFAQMAVLVHALALFREKLPTTAASLAVAMIPLSSILGRLLVGVFADRLAKRPLTMGMFAVQAVALALLSQAETPAALYVAAVVFGCTVGNVFMLQSLLVGELFGMSSFGTVYGLLTLVTQIAGGVGPWALGLLSERWGGYGAPVQLLAGIAMVSGVLLLALRPPDRVGTREPDDTPVPGSSR